MNKLVKKIKNSYFLKSRNVRFLLLWVFLGFVLVVGVSFFLAPFTSIRGLAEGVLLDLMGGKEPAKPTALDPFIIQESEHQLKFLDDDGHIILILDKK